VVAAANLSLNVGNMKEMEQCVIVLVLLAENRYSYSTPVPVPYHNPEVEQEDF
jgi:hypothetical protein